MPAMQRGMISLSATEQQTLSTLASSTPLESSLVLQKLMLPHSENNNQVEMSRDEAESLLDLLPIPSDAESREITTLRQKLSAFLQNL